MENKEIKEYELIFKSYQRMLLRELERVQEAVRSGDAAVAAERLDALITDTRESLSD